MTSLALAHLRLPLDHLENAQLKCIIKEMNHLDKSGLNEEHKISICCNGGWLRLSGLVKHDDSDTAQKNLGDG